MPYNDLSLVIRIQQSALSSKKKNRQSFIRGKWTKPISKSEDVSTISIGRLMRMI